MIRHSTVAAVVWLCHGRKEKGRPGWLGWRQSNRQKKSQQEEAAQGRIRVVVVVLAGRSRGSPTGQHWPWIPAAGRKRGRGDAKE